MKSEKLTEFVAFREMKLCGGCNQPHFSDWKYETRWDVPTQKIVNLRGTLQPNQWVYELQSGPVTAKGVLAKLVIHGSIDTEGFVSLLHMAEFMDENYDLSTLLAGDILRGLLPLLDAIGFNESQCETWSATKRAIPVKGRTKPDSQPDPPTNSPEAISCAA